MNLRKHLVQWHNITYIIFFLSDNTGSAFRSDNSLLSLGGGGDG